MDILVRVARALEGSTSGGRRIERFKVVKGLSTFPAPAAAGNPYCHYYYHY